MVKLSVLVQAGTERFDADVEVDGDELTAGNAPDRLGGVFTGLGIDPALAEFLLHAERRDGGSSHKLWLFGVTRSR